MIRITRALDASDRAACMALRIEVFVVEQSVPIEIEQDEYEDVALHFLACDGTTPIATARVVFRDAGTTAKIGRVAVRRAARAQGIGAQLMRAMEADPALLQADRLLLEAQVHARGFYERLGYTATGSEFMEAGIPHQAMVKPAQRAIA